MGKKNKKKLKKLQRQQLYQQKLNQAPQMAVQSTQPVVNMPVAGAVSPEVQHITEAPKETPVHEEVEESKDVKREIRKILLTIGALVIIIVVVYIINIKSDIVLKAGDWLSNSLNIKV